MKAKKILLGLAAMGLTAVVAVGGTLAFLSSQSNEIVNSFTVGNGFQEDEEGHNGVWVDEEDIDGEEDEAGNKPRTEDNQTYPDLLPGSSFVKDPTVHIVAGSVDSYVFMEVNGLDAAVAVGLSIDGINEAWVKVDNSTTLDGIYVYVANENEASNGDVVSDPRYTVVVDDDENVDLPAIFNKVTLADFEDEKFAEISEELGKTAIVVKACAVQAPNVTYEEALEAAKGTF